MLHDSRDENVFAVTDCIYFKLSSADVLIYKDRVLLGDLVDLSYVLIDILIESGAALVIVSVFLYISATLGLDGLGNLLQIILGHVADVALHAAEGQVCDVVIKSLGKVRKSLSIAVVLLK